MRLLIVFSLAILFQLATCSTEKCYDTTEHCHSTNYQTYVDCVRKRHKRSIDCDYSCDNGNCINTCNNCDCNMCNYSNCGGSCNNCCNTCCSNYISCRTNHCCHKTCHAQCDNTQCRTDCRRNCFNSIKNETIYYPIGGGGTIESRNYSSVIENNNKHNVTTIIHLNNVINNTNIVDIPIGLNNTNEQNITVISPQGTYHSGGAETEKCCTVIGPRQCVSDPTPRCFHYRSQQCGPFCTASIVHKEQQQVCESMYPGAPQNCRQQIFYIPQPQPRCFYQSTWPYVACGIQGGASCEGCYNHYVNQQSQNYQNCPPQCYDEGYNVGPMYRQGPYYRPWYYHAPCYSCYGYQNPYGGFPGANGDYFGGNPYGFNPYGQLPYPPFNPYIFPGYPILNQNTSVAGTGVPGVIAANSSGIYEPVMNVHPGLGAPYVPLDPYREVRDVEIEVSVEQPSPAQAQVKIKKEGEDKIERRVRKVKKEVENSTTFSKVA